MPYSALDFPMQNLESYIMWFWGTKGISAMVPGVHYYMYFIPGILCRTFFVAFCANSFSMSHSYI